MESVTPFSTTEVLSALIERKDLDAEQMKAIIGEMMTGRLGETETAAILIGLRLKGETANEIAAAASVLREHMIRFNGGGQGVLDTCGTGGDKSGTFNISTAAALVAAAAGVPVVKHGNRAMSSRSGSADVLAALGLSIEAGLEWSRRCFDRAGLAFCFAPHFHPALRHVGPVRRKLGVRTMFNLLGPLANPGRAEYQLLGVGQIGLLDVMANALAQLGTKHALLVCGRDGLDEVSLSAPTLVREVRGGTVIHWEWTPKDFGLEPCTLDELRVNDTEASAARIRAVVSAEQGAATRIVVANAAAALLASERVTTLAEGVEHATNAITGGRAREVLDTLIACSRESAAVSRI